MISDIPTAPAVDPVTSTSRGVPAKADVFPTRRSPTNAPVLSNVAVLVTSSVPAMSILVSIPELFIFVNAIIYLF